MNFLQRLCHEGDSGDRHELEGKDGAAQYRHPSRIHAHQEDERAQPIPPAAVVAPSCPVLLEALGLRQTATEPGEPQQRHRTDDVEKAPAVGQQVHGSENDGGQTVAQRAHGAEHSDPPAAVPRPQLLRQHHHRQHGLGVDEHARQELEQHELACVDDEGGAERADRKTQDRGQQQTSATQAVRQQRPRDGGDHTESHHGRHSGQVCLCDPEPLLNLQQGEPHDPHVVVVEELGGGQQSQDAPLAPRKRWDASQVGKDVGPAGSRRCRRLGGDLGPIAVAVL